MKKPIAISRMPAALLLFLAAPTVGADATEPTSPSAQLDAARLVKELNPTEASRSMVAAAQAAYLNEHEASPPIQRTKADPAVIPPGAPRATAGPDGFGYRSIDNLEQDGPVFDFIDISATGQKVVEGDQTSTASAPPLGIGAPIDLPVPFTLYGKSYFQMTMCANGYLTTDVTDLGADLSNDCPLPDAPSTPTDTTGARIYPLHDDLDLEPGIGAGYYQYFPSCPRTSDTGCDMGCHVFMWDNVSHFPGGVNSPQWDMEVLLYDNGDIVFQIGAGDPNGGISSTTGMQSEAFGDGMTNPDFGLTHVCNTPDSIAGNTAIRIFLDTDGDGFTEGYIDSDGDGTADRCDDCPDDPDKINEGACGCGVADDDSDGDGIPDCFDPCPDDGDSDNDGVDDCLDGCPDDPAKLMPGLCGCGTPDDDTDSDGVPDCNDDCPNDGNKIDAGACGCGASDIDTDGDGQPDCVDNCPNDPNPDQADNDGDGVGDACTPEPAGQNAPCAPGFLLMPMMLTMIVWRRRRRIRR